MQTYHNAEPLCCSHRSETLSHQMCPLLSLLLVGQVAGFTPRRSSVIQIPGIRARRRHNWRAPLQPHSRFRASPSDDLLGGSCEIGINAAAEDCNSAAGTESEFSAATNLAKCICGAGSFALVSHCVDEWQTLCAILRTLSSCPYRASSSCCLAPHIP